MNFIIDPNLTKDQFKYNRPMKIIFFNPLNMIFIFYSTLKFECSSKIFNAKFSRHMQFHKNKKLINALKVKNAMLFPRYL